MRRSVKWPNAFRSSCAILIARPQEKLRQAAFLAPLLVPQREPHAKVALATNPARATRRVSSVRVPIERIPPSSPMLLDRQQARRAFSTACRTDHLVLLKRQGQEELTQKA